MRDGDSICYAEVGLPHRCGHEGIALVRDKRPAIYIRVLNR